MLFRSLYADGLEKLRYRDSPLEVMAYDLQEQFELGPQPFDVETVVTLQLQEWATDRGEPILPGSVPESRNIVHDAVAGRAGRLARMAHAAKRSDEGPRLPGQDLRRQAQGKRKPNGRMANSDRRSAAQVRGLCKNEFRFCWRGRGSLAGMEAHAKQFQPKRKLLVGGQGIPLEDFLTQPAEYWLQ